MRRLMSLFRKRRLESQIDSELRFHIEQKAAELIGQGVEPGEARRRAMAKLGGVEAIKQEWRESRVTYFLESFFTDMRYAFHTLRKSPGFTIVAIVTLALGIGANTAIFSLTDQMLLQLLPVPHPNQLVVLRSTEGRNGEVWSNYDSRAVFSYPMYKALRDRNQVFSGLLACFVISANVSWQGHAQRATGELVSGNFFKVLGVRAALGRVFSASDETTAGANPVAVMSYGYWEKQFGSNPSLLNQSLVVNGVPLTLVGIVQPGFTSVEAGDAPDVYIPITMKPEMTPTWNGLDDTSTYFLGVIGRLRPGMSRTQAQAGIEPLFHALLESEEPLKVAQGMLASSGARKRFLAGRIELTPGARGRPVIQKDAQAPLTFLMAMAGLVLLIACANLACLLLARGEARQHEIALRLALGAGRPRVVRQLSAEPILIAAVGGGAGLLVGWWLLRLMLAMIPADEVAGFRAGLDLHVLAFASGATILSALFFGVLPAMRTSRADLQAALKEQDGRGSGSGGSTRLRRSLIVVQVALTTVLMVAAGLFGASLIHLERQNLGMKLGHVVQFSLDPGLSGYSPSQTLALFGRLKRDLAALPGVSSVGTATIPLLTGWNSRDSMTFEGYSGRGGEGTTTPVNWVSPRFFPTLGIPLIAGRTFRSSDSATSPKVAVINEATARRFFAGRNPVGLHLGIGWGPSVRLNVEIVGVVANAKSSDAHGPDGHIVYFPYTQDAAFTRATFYVRTRMDPNAIFAAIHDIVGRDAPTVPAYGVETLREQLEDSLIPDRLVTFLTLGFGLLAALLASVGLYGVMAYLVLRRTREIGIRMALGALPGNVARAFLWQAVLLTVVGLGIGMAAALAASHLIQSLLYGVTADTAVIYVLSGLFLTMVTLLACFIPARRAMRVDPNIALRQE